ncbi:MAG: hypothetical protein AAF460_16475 [Pseudomonadota bacterium]
MNAFRTLVATLGAAVFVYTLLVVPTHGTALVPVFVSDLLALNWRGQFNLDFACYLVLSALWVAWRGGFSRAALVLAALASVGGMLFFTPYLLVATVRSRGDAALLLLGVHAVSARNA